MSDQPRTAIMDWDGITDDDLTEAQEQAATALVNMGTEARAGQASCVLYDKNEQVIGNVTVAKVWKDPVLWVAFAYDAKTGDIVTATATPERAENGSEREGE